MSNTREGRGEARIPFARLWGRTSRSGTKYLTGRLGQARLLGFPGTDEEGTPVLDLVLVPGEQRARQAPTEALQEPPDAEPSAARQAVLRRAAHPRSAFAAPSALADDDSIPF